MMLSLVLPIVKEVAGMTLAQNIRYLRKLHNMSQDKLAEELGYKSFTTIQKWESGVSEPPLRVLRELASLYDVDMDDLSNVSLESSSSSTSAHNDTTFNRLWTYYEKLNPEGQKKILEELEDLSEHPKYKKISR